MEALMRVMAAKKREVSVVKEKRQSKKEKYLRRAEVESLLEEEEKAKEAPSKKRKLDQKTESAGSSQQAQEAAAERTDDKTQVKEESQAVLSWPDLRRRLRELGEPITLFGESMKDRMTRLRRAEMDAVTKHEVELGAGHDIRNRFVGGDGGVHGDQKDTADDAAEDAEEFDIADTAEDGGKSKTGGGNEEDEEKDADKMVYRFFKGMLQRWEKDLASRPDHVKRTAQGKIAVKTMKQCKDYIRPLFKLCKHRQVPSDILPILVEIVKFCRQGEFVMANDAYIKLAIGNAAWPIGVTMVGIHERTGREKINSNKQAHVMNNESQRKYLTSVKRLMSYAQSISNVLPSKRVL
ncbi:pre-mRNA-splicing factor 18, putative [Phytophthora infestans T30-4]|uniref:Pre-mRNA-splicing factor 18 n=2 Tax=Phytophthora infestans TaxID=4787 RepID=D0NFF0_PHYIT|nr:pre-mRNA-splicing factor 18, putative [Phytophthora infestans T30-4]EEY56939.1 pre-mRNA-splicing factor 18, putative [Phytophthora infestans T30-4]KAF4034350.1 Prp18 domain [Phytophthora infestans]|eukprot:XP_002902267.1 pre-mRNA-splicing factor 18, putative [Phytophthora infestans T30-4]